MPQHEEERVLDPTQLGATTQQRTAQEAAADLGRAEDLSFLGEAGRNPTAAAEQAVELVRSGEAGGMFIERPTTFPTDPPMEPGTSRASRELPELFVGDIQMDPEYERAQEMMQSDSFWERAAGVGIMRERDEMMVSPTVAYDPGVLPESMTGGERAMIRAAALTMYDPGEVAMMLLQPDPDDPTRQRWPELAVQQAPDGTLVIANNETGRRAIINRPGYSNWDNKQMLAGAAMFYPAGRFTGMFASTPGRMAAGAASAGLTETAIQYGQEAAGGDFDKLDIAITAGIGPAIDLARPLMGGAYRFTRFLGSYVPENFFGVQTAWQGLRSVTGEARTKMLDFIRNSRGFTQSGRPVVVTTQDAVPEAHTPFRHLLLKMVERMPLTGTGALREAQKNERVEMLRWMAARYGVNLNTNYGHRLTQALNANQGARMTAAQTAMGEATEALAENDIILRDFRFQILDLIDAEQRLGTLGDQGVINLLNKVRNQIWQGVGTQPGQRMPRDFGSMTDWLTYLHDQAANASPNARAALGEVADALERDLLRHATEEGGEAGARWVAANQQLRQLVRQEERNTLRVLIEAGEVDEEVVRRTIFSGDEALTRALTDNLTESGMNNARAMYLRQGLWDAGWRAGPVDDMTATSIDAARFLKFLDDNPSQIQSLWPDEADRRMLEGMREYLRMTARAQQTGQGIGMAAAAQTGFGTGLNLVTLGIAGLAGNAYQSTPIRNMLIRLSEIRANPRLKDDIMNQLGGPLMAAGREMAQQWTDADPYDQVFVSDALQQYYQDQANLQDAMNASTVRPGSPLGPSGRIDPALNQLRDAAGAEEEEGPGITERLMQMLNWGDEEEEAPQE